MICEVSSGSLCPELQTLLSGGSPDLPGPPTESELYTLQLAASNVEMTAALSTPPLQGRLPVAWEKLARCKRAYFGALAHYNIGMALLWAPSATDADAGRLVHVLMNAHSRAAAATAEHTLSRRPVYTDAALETPRGRLLLGNNSASLNLGATIIPVAVLKMHAQRDVISVRFSGHFSRLTWTSRYQNVSRSGFYWN